MDEGGFVVASLGAAIGDSSGGVVLAGAPGGSESKEAELAE